jgi:hypothetical protein
MNIFHFYNKIFYCIFGYIIMKYCIIIVCIGLIFFGCEKPPSYSDVPIIKFKSLSSNMVRSYSNTFADAQYLPDTVQIQISFTDGNGALGIPTGDTTSAADAIVVDSRLSPNGKLDTNYFSVPYITPNGNIKAISGTINFTMNQIYGRYDTAHVNWDTLHYIITIKDRNGNTSNAVQTPPIYIKDN